MQSKNWTLYANINRTISAVYVVFACINSVSLIRWISTSPRQTNYDVEPKLTQPTNNKIWFHQKTERAHDQIYNQAKLYELNDTQNFSMGMI